jgi:hypothetical protein
MAPPQNWNDRCLFHPSNFTDSLLQARLILDPSSIFAIEKKKMTFKNQKLIDTN